MRKTLKNRPEPEKNSAPIRGLKVKLLVFALLCALPLGGSVSLLLTGILPLFYFVADEADAPGLLVIGTAIVTAPFVVGVYAGVMQQLVRSGATLKKENDLTV